MLLNVIYEKQNNDVKTLRFSPPLSSIIPVPQMISVIESTWLLSALGNNLITWGLNNLWSSCVNEI